MKILLDTHVWLWMLSEPNRLSKSALDLVTDEKNELYLSVVSGWEIAIKYGLKKLLLPQPPQSYVPSRMSATGVLTLEINMHHVLGIAQLPLHHRDPFDRLLIQQASCENLKLLTADEAFHPYDVDLLWAHRAG